MSADMSDKNVHKAIAVMTGFAGGLLAVLASLLTMVSAFIDGTQSDALRNAAVILFGVSLVFILVCVWSVLKATKT